PLSAVYRRAQSRHGDRDVFHSGRQSLERVRPCARGRATQRLFWCAQHFRKMMRFAIHIVWLLLILLTACNPEKKSRQHIERLERGGEGQAYEVGIACMEYILKYGDDLAYSKALIKKLLDLNFPAESIQAVDRLLEKHPDDPELFCFRGIAYRRLHQYELAQKDLALALRLEPDNATFLREKEQTAERQRRWLEIQSLDSALTPPADSFAI